MTGHVLGPGVNFDAGNDSFIGDGFDKRRAVFLAPADRLVVEDRSADALAQAGRGHDQLPIGPPDFLGLGNAQCGKSSVDGRIAFIHRQQALVAGDERPRGAYQVLRTHLRSPTSGSEFSRSQMRRISKYMNAAVQPISTSPVNASIPAIKRNGPDGTRSP